MKKTPEHNNSLDIDLDDLIADLDFNEDSKTKGKNKAVTLWVPEEYHASFEDLQNQTKKKLGKKIQKMFMVVVDKARAKSAASKLKKAV